MGWQRMGLDKSHPLRPLWLQVGKRKAVSQELQSNIDARPCKKGARSEHVQDSLQFAPKTPQDVEPDVNSKSLRPREFTMQYGSKFEGKLLHDLIFVEICAGSARLTKAARDAGFNGIAVDHTHQRSCGIDICIFELEDQDQVNDLCQFLEAEADSIAAVWIAPSCGTASKAREKTPATTSKAWHCSAYSFEVIRPAGSTGWTGRYRQAESGKGELALQCSGADHSHNVQGKHLHGHRKPRQQPLLGHNAYGEHHGGIWTQVCNFSQLQPWRVQKQADFNLGK